MIRVFQLNRITLEVLLNECEWDVDTVAKRIGCHRGSVFRRMRKYGMKRPDHLYKPHPNTLKTHCPRGHEYAGHNLFVTNSGTRKCRECEAIKKSAACAMRRERGYTNPREFGAYYV